MCFGKGRSCAFYVRHDYQSSVTNVGYNLSLRAIESGVSYRRMDLFWKNTSHAISGSLLSRRTLVTGFDLVPLTAGCCFGACACLLWRNTFSCHFCGATLLLSRRMLVRSPRLMLVTTVGCCFGVWVHLCQSNSSYALGGYSSLQWGVAVLHGDNWATWVTRFHRWPPHHQYLVSPIWYHILKLVIEL